MMTDGGRRSRRILIVEDDPGSAAALVEALEMLAGRVERAATGRDALRQAAELEPDVVLLDLQLPDIDGAALARELKARFGAEMRFVALSGRPVSSDERDAFAACLLKPVGLAELQGAVGSLLE